MNVKILIFLIMSQVCFAQTHRLIDWKPCEDYMKTLNDQVKKFNDGHPEFLVRVSCEYVAKVKDKPIVRVKLTRTEAAILNVLRKNSTTVYKNEDSYEKWLINRHGIKQPDFGDPCWYFVGIKIGDNFITVDHNLSNTGCD
jgi:hypothetical protein